MFFLHGDVQGGGGPRVGSRGRVLTGAARVEVSPPTVVALRKRGREH